jgi:glycosyltransferase involved in cell wall biosynthesis
MIAYSDVSIVIPAYNEEDTIGQLISRIKKISDQFEIIVCSDGSTDNTVKVALEAGAIVVSHPYNLGNGATVKSGAIRATRDILLFIDADLQHQPEDIPQFLEFFPEYDMVIGARTRESTTSKYRNFGNFVLIKLAEIIAGQKILDLTSGFRAIKREIYMQYAHLYPLRYSYPTTITLACLLTGNFVRWVPLHSITKRKIGTSNIRPLRDGFKFIHIILRVIMTFSPLKIFLPLSFIMFFLGAIIAIVQLYLTRGFQSASLIFLLSGILLFLNGLIAEQISKIQLFQGIKKKS